jgi:hypothetical protein
MPIVDVGRALCARAVARQERKNASIEEACAKVNAATMESPGGLRGRALRELHRASRAGEHAIDGWQNGGLNLAGLVLRMASSREEARALLGRAREALPYVVQEVLQSAAESRKARTFYATEMAMMVPIPLAALLAGKTAQRTLGAALRGRLEWGEAPFLTS